MHHRALIWFGTKAYLSFLLPGAHRLEQPLDLHLMLHGLFVPITQEVLQHPFLLLQALAQVLSYFTLTLSKFTEQSSAEILLRKGWREFQEDVEAPTIKE